MKESINKEKEFIQVIMGTIPLITFTDSITNALTSGVLLLLTYLLSATIYLPVVKRLNEPAKTFTFLIITATIISIFDNFIAGYLPQIHIGINQFLPLIAVNSFLFAGLRNPTFTDSNANFILYHTQKCFHCIFLLTIIGMCREIIGKGTLFNQPLIISEPDGYLFLPASSSWGALLIVAMVFLVYGLQRRKK
ncbi:MAG: Rnf-Nqr domain containing protein [candidate division WOR-3 bacterium]